MGVGPAELVPAAEEGLAAQSLVEQTAGRHGAAAEHDEVLRGGAGAIRLAACHAPTVATERSVLTSPARLASVAGLSVLAGGSFIATASAGDPALPNAIGYAVPGAVFFLISAIRLGPTAKEN